MVKQLSKSSGAAKHSKPLAGVVCAVWSSSKLAISSLTADRLGREKVRSQSEDSIVRPTSLSWIHTMTLEGLSTCETPQQPSEWTKTTAAGQFLGDFMVIWRVGSGQFWHKWA